METAELSKEAPALLLPQQREGLKQMGEAARASAQEGIESLRKELAGRPYTRRDFELFAEHRERLQEVEMGLVMMMSGE